MSEKGLFIETIKEETLEQMRSFLSEHASNDVDYVAWQMAVELRRKAFEEVYESTTAFREEFDKTIEDFRSKSCDDKTCPEFILLSETNKKLQDLYSCYRKNNEVWYLIDKLSSKKIMK